MGKKIKFFVAGVIFALAVSSLGISLSGGSAAKAASSKTGAGLAEHALKAYSEGWQYSYGSYGQLRGGVRYSDCSGLIKSYFWWTGSGSDPNPSLASVPSSSSSMLASASESGSISGASSIPRIHGLILYSPGHVGVYIGNNMAVDNRCSGQNVKLGAATGGQYHWTKWVKLPQLSYPDNGFVKFNGSTYYYENGQYVVNTTKTIDGQSYSFGPSGAMTAGSVSSSDGSTDISSSGTLQVGAHGDSVAQLQNDLIKIGCMSYRVTGYYGSITQSAVAKFQQMADLKVTGIADKETLEAISKSV
jgi:hypothetical protein